MYLEYLLDNKYSKWYINIINSAKNRILDDIFYTEKHHIIPKSFGGSDVEENIVVLTYREHFLCHWLLVKCVKEPYKRKAFSALSRMRRNRKQIVITSSWRFDIMKKAAKNAMVGRKIKEETKQKNRDIALALHKNPEYIEKWITGMQNSPKPIITEKYIKASRNNILKYNGSDKHRADVSKAQKGKPKSESQRKKQSETMKSGAAAFGKRNGMNDPINRLKVKNTKIGLKALYKNGIKKMAKPDTEKWYMLIKQGFRPAQDMIG